MSVWLTISKERATDAEWTSDEARLLKRQSIGLLAESLSMVWAELANGQPAAEVTHKTVRYPEGGAEKIERAALIAERCDRRVVRNLRGWLLSVPHSDSDDCKTGEPLQAPSPAVVLEASR